MSYYKQQLESFLATLDVKATTVYDIGGKQGSVAHRVKSWDVEQYKVLDLPEYDLDYIGEEDWIGDFMWLPKADLVFCLEVFEYLISPLQALSKIKHILKPGGRAYVTFAFVYPTHNELELDSTRYTERGVHRLAEEIGLKVANIWYRTDKSGLLQSFYSMDGMHPAKGYAHHDATGFIVEFVK